MLKTPLIPLKDSIATQLLKNVFALYLVLVVTVTLLHLLSVYVHTKASVLEELEIIGATFTPGLEQALWEMNLTQMHSITAGIAQLPAIVGVRIEDDQGNTIQQIGEVRTQQGETIKVNREGTQELENPTARLFGHEFPLLYTRGDQKFPVGNVTMFSSSGVVFERIRFGFLLLMIAAVIQIIAFWMLFLWISRTRLSRPLTELTYVTGQLDLDNLENINIRVHTSGRNELKILEETFNAMVQKLLDARTTLYEYANELQQSRQQLQDILDNTTAVIFIKDTEGRYLLINRQYESLFHVSKSEITGKTDYEIFPKEVADVFSHNDQQVINAKCPLEVEEYAPHDDGIHTYLSVKFPLRDAIGRMYAVCGIATDISERKETEKHIRKLNQELEHRVQERTARLSDINALLKDSEQRLKEAQRIAQLGNWDWNIQKNELFWSDEIYRIFGLQPQEFGATYEAFLHAVHPEDRDSVQQSVNESLYHGKSYSIDHRIVLPDGTVRVVHEQGEVTFDEQYEPVQMLGTVQDITERQRAEEALRVSEAELRALFAGMTDVVLMFDREGRYLKIAPASTELLYKPADELLGKTLHEVFPQEQADMLLRYIRQSLETQQLVGLEYSLNIGGNDIWFDGRVSPMSHDAVIFVARDITERKRMEDDLRHAKDAAEAVSRAKSVFLANMSHELRTPLHGILGFAQRLERDAALTDTQHQSVGIIYRNGEHLLTLLNDILDFTKIEANALELHPSQFVLRSMLAQFADMYRLNAERKGLTFVYDAPDDLPHIVYGDQKRLRQILLNLLGNAIRFTEQGNVTFKILDLGFQIAEGDEPKSQIAHLKFEISDTGIGIASEQLETLFQPFQQADPQRLQEGRRGLGLAISQRFVHLMGSQLHVTSTVGAGSTFWFELELPVIDTPATDVPYQVQADALEHPPRETLTAALAALPSDWLATLRQGAADVDPEALADIIARIRKRDLTLAGTLVHLTEEFEYDEILNLIHAAKKEEC